MKNLIITLLITCAVSCTSDSGKQNEEGEKLSRFSWLAGTWTHTEDEATYTESWFPINDSIMYGTAFMMSGEDTLFTEELSIVLRGGQVYYVPVIPLQNNGNPVVFELVSDSAGVFVFANNGHDFPQRIVYTHPHADTLHAWIEGLDKGEERREDFWLAKR